MDNLTFAEWLGTELQERGWSPADFRRKLEERGVTSARQRLAYWLSPVDLPEALFAVLATALQWTPDQARELRASAGREGFALLVRARARELRMTQRALVATLAAEGVRGGSTAYLYRWLAPQAPKRGVLDVMLSLLGLSLERDREKVLQAYALAGGAIPLREHDPPPKREAAA